MIQRNPQFWFFRKGFGSSFSTTFCVWFFKKNVFHVMFYHLTKFIAWLSFVRYTARMSIAIICFLGCDNINFRINPIFLIKRSQVFFYLTKKSRQKCKCLENLINRIYKELSVAQNCLRPESAPLTKINISCVKSCQRARATHPVTSIWCRLWEDLIHEWSLTQTPMHLT